MIKAVRSQVAPQVLSENREIWIETVIREMGTGISYNKTSVATKYNHADIKEQLLSDIKNKCMYCESRITHIDFGDIEHIKPKADFPAHAFDWENLGISCAVCNNKKRNHYAPTPLVDPYTENPDDFLFSGGQVIFGKVANDRAQLTIIKLDLNRPELLEQRKTKMDEIFNLVDRAARVDSIDLRDALLDEAALLASSEQEYSLVAGTFFRELKLKCGM
jgi:uncharacterized protein (TIGR02646 family)